MRTIFLLALTATTITSVLSQRPFYAGYKPIGYPELAARFEPEEVPTTTQANLQNRFDSDGQLITTTTMRLPVDALGDRELVERISKWPQDKWPFWYANWRAIEEHRARPVGNTVTTNTRSSFARDPSISNQQQQQAYPYPNNNWSSRNSNSNNFQNL